MSMKPLISVVIPTYNDAHHLKRSVGSVLSQSYSNFEVIVVDNSSLDNTKAVLDAFKDERIKYFLINNKGSIAASRNLGIRNASGSWVAFLDSDDFWYKDKLTAMFCSDFCSENFEAISHNVLTVDVNGDELRKMVCGPFTDTFYYDLLFTGNRCSTSAMVVKSSFLRANKLKFNESADFITVEDYGLWLDMANLGAKFKFINQALSEYLVHENNNSSKVQFHFENCRNLLRHHVFTVSEFPDEADKLWKAIETRLKMQMAIAYFRQGQYLSAFYFFGYGVCISPKYFTTFLLSKYHRRLKAKH